jgi:hypothetical protein
MYAQKSILNTDRTGKPLKWPKLPPNRHFEAIFIELPEETHDIKQTKTHRHPHPKVVGSVNINGNIIDTAQESQWNLPK